MPRVRIFETDPEAAKRPTEDVVGRVFMGEQANGQPVLLDAFKFVTDEEETAQAVADLYGGTVEEDDSGKDVAFVVYTEADRLDVIVERVDTSMVLFGRKGLIRSCDGITQTDGSECVCPQRFTERKEAASQGNGCDPNIHIYFRLQDAPDLGLFRWRSSSWSLLRDIGREQDSLEEFGGKGLGHVAIKKVTTKAGRALTLPEVRVTDEVPVEGVSARVAKATKEEPAEEPVAEETPVAAPKRRATRKAADAPAEEPEAEEKPKRTRARKAA